jgi:TorA maturation chaperone TorD
MPAIAPDAAAIDLARECLYRFFAAALSDPRGPGWGPLADLADRWLAGTAADLLRAEAAADPIPLGPGERPPGDLDLSAVLPGLCGPRDELAAEYDQVFGLVGVRECMPYATEYGPNEPFARAQQLADVAGYYAAFGLRCARARPDRADHVALELEFLAHLLQKQRLADDGTPAGADRAAVCADAARRFFRDHVAPWAPSFAAGLQRRGGGGFYGAVGRALAAFLPAERGRLGVKAPTRVATPTSADRAADDAGCAGCPAGA